VKVKLFLRHCLPTCYFNPLVYFQISSIFLQSKHRMFDSMKDGRRML